MNTIYVGSLLAGDYELRVTGFDIYQDVADPYSLTVSVAPLSTIARNADSQLPEPGSAALVLIALLALNARRIQTPGAGS